MNIPYTVSVTPCIFNLLGTLIFVGLGTKSLNYTYKSMELQLIFFYVDVFAWFVCYNNLYNLAICCLVLIYMHVGIMYKFCVTCVVTIEKLILLNFNIISQFLSPIY